jgi:CheY-like chemotaxis protein
MPRVDGVEVLRRLKADPTTRNIPVIMLTTTDDPREI